MHGLVRCKHEHRCSHAPRVDVSFRYVTIKIPDRGYDQGCEWHHAPEAWAEIWEKSVSWVPAWEKEGWLSGLIVARWICALRVPRVSWVESWRCKSSQHRRIVSLSPYGEKPFNSKVIKSFVPELRSRKCFLCFGIPTLSIYELWTFYVHFTYPYHGHVTIITTCWKTKTYTYQIFTDARCHLEDLPRAMANREGWCACGVMVIVVGNGHGDTSSNPGRDCISHSTNTLGKGMNPISLPPAMGK